MNNRWLKFRSPAAARRQQARRRARLIAISVALHLLFLLSFVGFSGHNDDGEATPQYIAVQFGGELPPRFESEFIDNNESMLEKEIMPEPVLNDQVENEEFVQDRADIAQKKSLRKQFQAAALAKKQATQAKLAHQADENAQGDKGKIAADYLELLQLTVQETSQIPIQARQEHISGNAILRLTFNRDGYVTRYSLRRPTGHEILDNAAIAVAEKLLTEPFPPMPDEFESGKKVTTYDFPISFKAKN